MHCRISCLSSWSHGQLGSVAQHPKGAGTAHCQSRENQNSKCKVRFLLNACHFLTVVKLKTIVKLNCSKSGIIHTKARLDFADFLLQALSTMEPPLHLSYSSLQRNLFGAFNLLGSKLLLKIAMQQFLVGKQRKNSEVKNYCWHTCATW